MASKSKFALHWKILIGLALGIVVGLSINLLWHPQHRGNRRRTGCRGRVGIPRG